MEAARLRSFANIGIRSGVAVVGQKDRMVVNMRRLDYRQYLSQSKHWKRIRAAALKRAGGKCQLCGERAVSLNVHHNTYSRTPGRELAGDLIVLCTDCHTIFHTRLALAEKREPVYAGA